MSRTYYTTFYPEEDTIGSKGSAAFLAYTAKLTVYKRSLTAPTTPSGGSYNFDGGVLTPPSGWTVNITAGSDPVWESTTNVSTFVRNDVVNTLTWSTPVEILRSGTIGVSPILVSLSRPTVNIMTDSNGNNGIYTNSGTNISVVQGLTTLEYDGVGTSTGTWKILSVVPSNITNGSTAADSASYAIINDHNNISASTASIIYNITGTSSAGTAFTTSVTQTFTRLVGAVVDTTPPGQVAGLTLSTSTETLAGGSVQVKLKATWTANAEADLSYYEPEIKLTAAADTTYIGYQTATNSYEWPVTAGTSYTVRVRAADKSDNKGAYSAPVALVSGTDSVAPGVPTALTAVATFKNIFLSWTNTNGATDTDLAAVEIWEATTNNSASATKIATVNAVKGAPGGFTRSGVANGTTYYYFLKSVDTSNNISAFTATNSAATTQSSVTAAINGAFTFTGNSTGLSLGNVVTVIGTLGGTGSISGYTSGTNYVVSATNGSTTATLVAADGTTLTTTAGTITGLTFTVVRSAAIPAAVGTSDIIAGSITADRLRVGAITADIIAVPANQASTGGLNSTIQVGTTGVTIGNPIGLIENSPSATTISPGKILISGATTLANWRNGSDATKIEGGSIAANTISANKIQIGMRGVDIAGIQFQANEATNTLSWTAGTITYTKDDGTITSVSITAGSATWTTGTLYIYWVKNDTTPNTTLQSSTATGTAYGADKIVFATYRGTVDFVANYGRTIIDGSQITTGTVNADRFKADSIIGNRLYLGGSNFRINGAEQGAGKGTLTVSNGTYDLIKLGYVDANTVGFQITNTSGEVVISSTTPASSINNSGIAINASGQLTGIGTGANTVVDNSRVTVGGRNLILGSSSGTGWSGFTTRTGSTFSLTAASTVETSYIYSPYFNMWGNQEITVSFESTEDASILSRDLFILPDNYSSIGLLTQSFAKSTSGYTKYSFTFTTPAAWGTITSPASVRFRMDHNGSTGGVSATISIRNVKLELGNRATDWSPAPEDLVSVDLSNAPSGIRNSNITINNNGSLSGAGSGQVTIGGLGYTGDLNATNGATFGTNINGQITATNAGTYIANAAIGSALIGSIALVGTSNFSVRTSDNTSISRIEMNGQVIKIFEGSNLRIKIGNLAA